MTGNSFPRRLDTLLLTTYSALCDTGRLNAKQDPTIQSALDHCGYCGVQDVRFGGRTAYGSAQLRLRTFVRFDLLGIGGESSVVTALLITV